MFKFSKLEIPRLILIESDFWKDDRGFFMEVYKNSEFKNAGILLPFLQDNYSFSKKNVLRGMHFQKPPYGQAKLVRCIRGEILDVAVDINPDSKTYKRWVSVVLSGDNGRQLYIPKDFAHGFIVLSEEAEVSYKCDSEYAPQEERGIIWNDPDIDINWPNTNPILSEKDRKNLPLSYFENNNELPINETN